MFHYDYRLESINTVCLAVHYSLACLLFEFTFLIQRYYGPRGWLLAILGSFLSGCSGGWLQGYCCCCLCVLSLFNLFLCHPRSRRRQWTIVLANSNNSEQPKLACTSSNAQGIRRRGRGRRMFQDPARKKEREFETLSIKVYWAIIIVARVPILVGVCVCSILDRITLLRHLQRERGQQYTIAHKWNVFNGN